MNQPAKKDTRRLEGLTTRWIRWASSPWALEVVLLSLAAWLGAGPFLNFSANWQAVLYISSAVITLVMVFLLVRTQAKDTLAMQMKLNEIIGALKGANNQLISIENLGEVAIQELSARYETVASKLLHDDAVSTESIVSHEIVVSEEEKKGAE